MSINNSDLMQKSVGELTELVSNKKVLALKLAETYGKAPLSVRNNWLSGFYSVPKALVTKVKADMVAFINDENNS